MVGFDLGVRPPVIHWMSPLFLYSTVCCIFVVSFTSALVLLVNDMLLSEFGVFIHSMSSGRILFILFTTCQVFISSKLTKFSTGLSYKWNTNNPLQLACGMQKELCCLSESEQSTGFDEALSVTPSAPWHLLSCAQAFLTGRALSNAKLQWAERGGWRE